MWLCCYFDLLQLKVNWITREMEDKDITIKQVQTDGGVDVDEVASDKIRLGPRLEPSIPRYLPT